MSNLVNKLRDRPIIYEVVPPRLDISPESCNSTLKMLQTVLDEPRIDAFNVPEIIERKEFEGTVTYNQLRVNAEDYASLIQSKDKEAIVNVIAPRMQRENFSERVSNILDNGIHNVVIVGKEKSVDVLPGPNVIEALDIISGLNKTHDVKIVPGGITMFQRNQKESHGYPIKGTLDEYQRVALKADHGCKFVTSQIIFDSAEAIDFLARYGDYVLASRENPVTVFISLSTIASEKVMDLMDFLGVYLPTGFRKELKSNFERMGIISVEHSIQVLGEVMDGIKDNGASSRIPIGLHVEQVGSSTKSMDLSLSLLDRTYKMIKSQ
ncbi:MAG TPA: hypothetical protein VKK79_17120 [Candidatus Lokiarchaeia archaeon]|nr:hypothetical protein [Candidatus Lokiarchaeia archaeon]